MGSRASRKRKRDLVDQKLMKLALFAKELCPAASVEAHTKSYEDEDGRLKVFPPSCLPEGVRRSGRKLLQSSASNSWRKPPCLFFALCSIPQDTWRTSNSLNPS